MFHPLGKSHFGINIWSVLCGITTTIVVVEEAGLCGSSMYVQND